MTVTPSKSNSNAQTSVSIISPTKQTSGPPNVIHINIPVTGMSPSSIPMPFPSPISTDTVSSEGFSNSLPSENIKFVNLVKPDVGKKETQILNPASLKGLKPVPKHVLENSSFTMTKNPLTEQLSIPVTMTNFRIMPTSVGGKVAAQHAQTVVSVTGAQQSVGQSKTFQNTNLLTNPVIESPKNQINAISTNNSIQSSAVFQGSEFTPPKHVMLSSTSDNAIEIEQIIKNHKGILSSCTPQDLKGAKVVTYSLSNIKSQMPGKSEAPTSQHVKTEPFQSCIPSHPYQNFPGLNITVLPKNTETRGQFVKVDQVQEPLNQKNSIQDATNQGISTVNNISLVGSPTYKPSNISPNKSIGNTDTINYNTATGVNHIGHKLIVSQESPKQGHQLFLHDSTSLVKADEMPERSTGEYIIQQQQPVFNQHPEMTNSQIVINMPHGISSPNKIDQIIQNQIISSSPTQPTFAVRNKPPQMNLIPIQGLDPSGKTLVPTTMFNFVPVPPDEVIKHAHGHHHHPTADVVVSEVKTLVYSQTIPQEQTIITSTQSPTKPKKSRAKKQRESIKQKTQKLENALNIQHVSNIMAITNYQNQESRYQIPENLEDEFLNALEEECGGVEPNKAKLDIYKRFYNHPGCVNNVRYINASNMETYLDRSMLDNKKYLYSLLR